MSGRPRLAFERVEIRRMPGIDAGFAIDGLCPGINVIVGPNASGKTSLTRAVSTLLWPRSGAASRAVLHGRFALDGRSWLVGYDTGSSSCQCDGQDADFPTLDSAEESNRYLLALHDLLRADNRGFAEAILRESSGGYDIGQAMGALTYTEKPAYPTSPQRHVQHALDRVRDARQMQEALLSDERRREELQGELRQAQQARQRALAIERALEFQQASASRDEAARNLALFPALLASLSGNELDELQRLRERQAQAVIAVERESQLIDRERQRWTATGLTSGLRPGLGASLRERCAELQQDAAALAAATESRAEAEAVLRAAREAIGPDAVDQQLAMLDAVQLNAFAELARRSHAAQQDVVSLASISNWLSHAAVTDPGSAAERDNLVSAVHALTRWLREGRAEHTPAAGGRAGVTAALVASGLAIIEVLLLGVLAHPAFFVMLLPGIVLLVLSLIRTPREW